ncbi:MAG: hypothetical protein KAS02_01030 [Candidatus Pacebacteria bacterium]|nr:hypothetical protein [Candidatus Paceibacterota bacterium]
MEKKLKLYKKISETPLECIERFKKDNPEYQDDPNTSHRQVKMTYAGRLDPMAEGELLVLVGEECKKKEEYLGLDKEYEVDILFGFSTDTYDTLGLINHLGVAPPSDYDVMGHVGKVGRFLNKLVGKREQEYPPFSSKTVDGKQLFQITKDDELTDVEIPKKEIEIYETELLKNYYISGRDLKGDIMKRILLVSGDFRQEEILENWNKELEGREEEQFLISKIRVKCSSGTYMRSIAQNLGEFLEIPALALKIKRINIFS